MVLARRHPALFFAGILCASAALAALALWILSHARTPFDYMVVGSLGTTIAIAAGFVITVLRGRRGKPS